MTRTRRTPALLAVVALVASLLLTAPPASSFPVPLPTAPEGDVAGVNDWDCLPSTTRPVPVVLVHGTFGDRRHLLEPMSRAMLAEGYCVFSLDYGNRGTGPIEQSAEQLRDFVDDVRARTGAAKVSLVGHSQGGMMPRHYIKFLGGDEFVDDLVGIAPSNHGTTLLGGALALGGGSQLADLVCAACRQQAAGSEFLAELNADDETPGDVSYTQITTRYDQVVLPHTSGHLADGPRTTNVTVQDTCRFDLAEHVLVPMSRTAIAFTLDALSRPGPADPDLAVRC